MGSQRIRSNSSAQHSAAKQKHAADLDKEKLQSAESHLVGSFLANLRRGHSQLLPNTPHGSRSTKVHVHVALLPAWCTHVSCSVLYTFNAIKSDGGRKKSAKKFPLAGRAVAHYLGTEYVLWTWRPDESCFSNGNLPTNNKSSIPLSTDTDLQPQAAWTRSASSTHCMRQTRTSVIQAGSAHFPLLHRIQIPGLRLVTRAGEDARQGPFWTTLQQLGSTRAFR